MAFCFETGCAVDLQHTDDHMFSGYGYCIHYCAKHCPRSYDGTDCDMEHPAQSTIERTTSERGFELYRFIDRYGQECSLQKSSLASESAIWLGCGEGVHYKGGDARVLMEHKEFEQKGLYCVARMHLTQEQVAALIPLLQHFVDTGELP